MYMKSYRCCSFTGFLVLFLLSINSVAQRSFSVVIVAQAHGMVPRFADNQPVNAQISIPPQVYRSGLVGAVVELSPRLAVQATAGFASYGLTIRRQYDYPRHRYKNSGSSSTATNALEFALVARRYFSSDQRPDRSWFTDVGLDAMYLGNTGKIGGIYTLGFGLSNPPPNETGMSGSVYAVGGNPYRVGIRAGIGHEWALGRRHFVALELLASYGLRDLQRFEMKYTVWNQGPTIDPRKYENTIATRVSFIGLQGSYRFQVSKPTAPRD